MKQDIFFVVIHRLVFTYALVGWIALAILLLGIAFL